MCHLDVIVVVGGFFPFSFLFFFFPFCGRVGGIFYAFVNSCALIRLFFSP